MPERVFRLLAAQASNPAVELGKLVAKRKDFANRAAKVGIVLPEFGAVDVRLLFNRDVRLQGFYLETKEIFEPLFKATVSGKSKRCRE